MLPKNRTTSEMLRVGILMTNSNSNC